MALCNRLKSFCSRMWPSGSSVYTHAARDGARACAIMARISSTRGRPVLRCRTTSSRANTGPIPPTRDTNDSGVLPVSSELLGSSSASRLNLSPARGNAYASYSPIPCCGVIGKNEEITRRSASSRMMFGEFGNSSKMTDIVSSSLLGTTVLKLNSTMRSESGFLKPMSSADVRCLRNTIRKSVPADSTGGRVSDAYSAGFCTSATILSAGNLADLV